MANTRNHRAQRTSLFTSTILSVRPLCAGVEPSVRSVLPLWTFLGLLDFISPWVQTHLPSTETF